VLIDACYSGGGEGRTPLVARRGIKIEPRIPVVERVYVITGAKGTQPSLDFETAKHGYFTYYLLLGLKGKADGAGGNKVDGVITMGELFTFVKERVENGTNGRQIPVMEGDGGFVVGKCR